MLLKDIVSNSNSDVFVKNMQECEARGLQKVLIGKIVLLFMQSRSKI